MTCEMRLLTRLSCRSAGRKCIIDVAPLVVSYRRPEIIDRWRLDNTRLGVRATQNGAKMAPLGMGADARSLSLDARGTWRAVAERLGKRRRHALAHQHHSARTCKRRRRRLFGDKRAAGIFVSSASG